MIKNLSFQHHKFPNQISRVPVIVCVGLGLTYNLSLICGFVICTEKMSKHKCYFNVYHHHQTSTEPSFNWTANFELYGTI